MRLPIAIAAALSLVACAVPRIEVLRTTSTQTFNPTERRAVWGRAVNSFNHTGLLILSADATAGVLRSQTQPAITPCSKAETYGSDIEAGPGRCYESRVTQFTMSDSGVAVLRVNRAVRGLARGGELLNDREREAAEQEVAELLRFIIGESKEMPPAPARTHEREVDAI